MSGRLRVIALGAGAALAVALPAALVAQVLEAIRDEGEGAGLVTYVLAAIVLAAMVLGGWVVGRQRAAPGVVAVSGAAAGIVAITAVLALGVARRLVAGDEVAWATVPATMVVAGALAALGGALGSRGPGRKRP